MKKTNKKIAIIITMFLLLMLLSTTNVHAALQSNGDSPTTRNLGDWMLEIREMQSSGGTLGLTDTINATELTSSNKNLDIHMEKNTEYGAMILLSASSYGNPNEITNGQTTTGNASGIVMEINKEWVVAGVNSNTPNFRNALGRYKNEYTMSYSAKDGDAILNWHGASSTTWINSDVNGALLRSYEGSIFSYNGKADDSRGPAIVSKLYSSRAVIVVGTGI